MLWGVTAEVLEPRGAAFSPGSLETNFMAAGATEPHLENGNMENQLTGSFT